MYFPKWSSLPRYVGFPMFVSLLSLVNLMMPVQTGLLFLVNTGRMEWLRWMDRSRGSFLPEGMWIFRSSVFFWGLLHDKVNNINRVLSSPPRGGTVTGTVKAPSRLVKANQTYSWAKSNHINCENWFDLVLFPDILTFCMKSCAYFLVDLFLDSYQLSCRKGIFHLLLLILIHSWF